jgi:hypothetical protein
MKALIFIQNLKQTLLEIEASRANHIFFVAPDFDLIQRLKAYSIGKLENLDIGDRRLRGFSTDLLSRDIFNLRTRYCIVKLKEFQIREDCYFDYIAKAIDLLVSNSNNYSYRPSKIEELLTLEIAKCFEPWYRPDDLFLVDFAQDHQLILANPAAKNWTVSNLGKYFSQLPLFEAIAFLCGLEVVLTLEHHKRAFISKQLLEDILEPKSEKNSVRQGYTLPYSLSLLGIVTGYHGAPQNREVTDFGYRILLYVQSHLKQFQNIVMLLLESEITGLKHQLDVNIEEVLSIIDGTSLLVDDDKKSVRNAIVDYESGKYLDSLRVINPILEGAINSALILVGLDPESMRGMKDKRDALKEKNLISLKLSMGLEICTTIRNKVAHGNILEADIELVRPLFPLVLNHLKRLITELDENLLHEQGTA